MTGHHWFLQWDMHWQQSRKYFILLKCALIVSPFWFFYAFNHIVSFSCLLHQSYPCIITSLVNLPDFIATVRCLSCVVCNWSLATFLTSVVRPTYLFVCNILLLESLFYYKSILIPHSSYLPADQRYIPR